MRGKEYFKKIQGKFFGMFTDEKADLKTKLFRVTLFLGIVAFVFSTLNNLLFLHAGFAVAGFTLLGAVELGVAFFLTFKLKSCRNLFMGSLIFNGALLFPLAFLKSGGLQSGMPLLLMFSLMMVFALLDGWRMYVTLVFTVGGIITAYLLSVYRPEWVNAQPTYAAALQDSCFDVLLIGFAIGLMFRFEERMYRSQQEMTERQREELRQLNNSRSQFFANMSHEIRTPINAILGLNEMTLREDVSEEVAENAVNIQKAGKILLALINDILDLSKLESGKMELTPTQYETAELFSDLVNLIWGRAREKNLAFHVDVDEALPSVLFGDEVRIKQVLVNLLNNAVKYTETGSVSLTVKSTRVNINCVQLRMEVRDTGIGIRREDIDALFADFRRVDEKRNRKIEGTGLGLSIVKQLVDLMGGTITVDSIYTKGSVFTVTLEQQIVSNAPLGSLRAASHRAQKQTQYVPRFEAPDAQVLIVDDNEMNLLVAKKLLRGTRVHVDTASGGQECLQKTLNRPYHVIFMDDVMPDMNGQQTLKALRERTEGFCQTTPVVALTANVMPNAMEHYQGQGFNSYLAKPINSAALEAVLKCLLPEELVEESAQPEEEKAADYLSSVLYRFNRKKPVCITTDCVCDLPQELLRRFDIRVMYYYVSSELGRFQDTTEITADNLLEYMSQGHKAVSGPPSAEEYEAFFADSLMGAESVIHISMSSRVSEGFAAASRAAGGFNNVVVLDSGHLSSGLGLIVLKAAQMAKDGESVEDIRAAVERMRDKVSTSYIVTTMENLYRTGRLSRNSYLLCHMLQIRPELAMLRGRMTVGNVYFGDFSTVAMHYIHRKLRAKRRIDPSILFITYSGCTAAQLADIRAEAERCFPFKEIYLQKATASIASNCGTGAFGLLYLKK